MLDLQEIKLPIISRQEINHKSCKSNSFWWKHVSFKYFLNFQCLFLCFRHPRTNHFLCFKTQGIQRRHTVFCYLICCEKVMVFIFSGGREKNARNLLWCLEVGGQGWLYWAAGCWLFFLLLQSLPHQMCSPCLCVQFLFSPSPQKSGYSVFLSLIK